MALSNPYSNYQKTAIETATPTRLVIMLYDGAIRFLNQAIPFMALSDFAAQSQCIGKAQAIIAHLRATLDFDAAPNIARDLDTMYVLLYDSLTEANIKDKPEKVEEVITGLRELREAWIEVDKQIQTQKGDLKKAADQLEMAAA